MDTAINMAPSTGVFALCMALGLARATFYRRRRTAAMPLHAGIPVSENTSARSFVAVRGHEAEGADGPPTEPVLVADVAAARNEANRTTVDVIAVKKTSPRALSQGERARVLAVLTKIASATWPPPRSTRRCSTKASTCAASERCRRRYAGRYPLC